MRREKVGKDGDWPLRIDSVLRRIEWPRVSNASGKLSQVRGLNGLGHVCVIGNTVKIVLVGCE